MLKIPLIFSFPALKTDAIYNERHGHKYGQIRLFG